MPWQGAWCASLPLHPPAAGTQGWCNLFDVERFKFLMEKLGLYRRLHGPQLLLRQHERQIRWRMQAAAAMQGAEAGGAGDERARAALWQGQQRQ